MTFATWQEAFAALVDDRQHRLECPRCRDIARGSCDRCYLAENLGLAASAAMRWFKKYRVRESQEKKL